MSGQASRGGGRSASGRRAGASQPASSRSAAAEGGHERARRSDLGARLAVALPAGAFALFLVIEGHLIFSLGVILAGAICLHELFDIYARMRPARLAALLALVALVLVAQYAGPRAVLLVLVASLPLIFALVLGQAAPSTVGIAITLLGVCWVGLGFAHAVLLRALPHGEGVLIDVLVGTFIGDTGAYLGGRLFGRRPLAPTLSPNKTIEGLIAGLLSTVVAVWLASRYQQDWMPGSHAIVLGVGVALAAPAGDLFESFVKRRAGVKDTGKLFGAHGGALDRLDALLFTVVVGYYIWAAYV